MKKTEKAPEQKPTPEQVREWTKKDLIAAHYFLGMLQRYPEIIDKLADEIYAHAMARENGAAIAQKENQH